MVVRRYFVHYFIVRIMLKSKPLSSSAFVIPFKGLIGLNCELEMHSRSASRSAYRCSRRRTLLSPTWAVSSTLLIVEQPSSHRQWAVESPTSLPQSLYPFAGTFSQSPQTSSTFKESTSAMNPPNSNVEEGCIKMLAFDECNSKYGTP